MTFEFLRESRQRSPARESPRGHGGYFPINVLNAIKMLPEVCRVFCATANATQVIIAETEQGRGSLGVIDGDRTKGVETDCDVSDRTALLRKIGYKL